MKQIICLVVIGIALSTSAQMGSPKHTWTAKLKVVDDTDQPIEAANAHVYYLLTNELVGPTDKNGMFIASHEDGSENLAFYVEKDGYYPFRAAYHMGRRYKSDTWNPNQIIVLKKIKNPIPLYAKRVNAEPPINQQPVGFDLMMGDWVAPYGKGVNADILFTREHNRKSLQDYDYKLTVTFPNSGDGIHEFKVTQYYLHTQGSALRSDQEAPAGGYEPKLVRISSSHPGQNLVMDYDENRAYYFRVRTMLDEKGNVKSALYGKIYGDFMDFRYYLNPTPNDRNIEFDPKHNLLHGLKPLEDVEEP